VVTAAEVTMHEGFDGGATQKRRPTPCAPRPGSRLQSRRPTTLRARLLQHSGGLSRKATLIFRAHPG
jgi:hypothetical protein